MIGGIGRWLCLFVLLFAGILPATAGAQVVRPERMCHADAEVRERWADVDVRPERWRCDNSDWSLSSDAVLVRFDLGQAEGRVLPQSVVTHTGNFERIDVGVIEANGTARWFSSWPADVHHLATGPYMVVPVPGVTSDTRTVAVRVVRPWSKTTLSEMRLDPYPEGTGWPLQRIVAMAAICGMLLVPLLINTAFYSVLPERYVIWHLVMVASMLVQAAFATGFFHVMIGYHAPWEWQASIIAFSGMSGAALMFAATFIEADALSPRLRRLATRVGPAVWGVGIVCCIPVEAVRPWSAPAMHVAIGLVIVLLAAMLWDAKRRGSQSVRLQILAWTPIMAIGS